MKKITFSKLVTVLIGMASILGISSPASAITIKGSAVSGAPCYVFFSGEVTYGRKIPSTGVTILFIPPNGSEINTDYVVIDPNPLPGGTNIASKNFQWAGVIPGYEQKIPAGSKIKAVTNRQTAVVADVAACG